MIQLDPFLWFTPAIAGVIAGTVRGLFLVSSETKNVSRWGRYSHAIWMTFSLNLACFLFMIVCVILTDPGRLEAAPILLGLLILAVISAIMGTAIGLPVAILVSFIFSWRRFRNSAVKKDRAFCSSVKNRSQVCLTVYIWFDIVNPHHLFLQ